MFFNKKDGIIFFLFELHDEVFNSCQLFLKNYTHILFEQRSTKFTQEEVEGTVN